MRHRARSGDAAARNLNNPQARQWVDGFPRVDEYLVDMSTNTSKAITTCASLATPVGRQLLGLLEHASKMMQRRCQNHVKTNWFPNVVKLPLVSDPIWGENAC
jgi:hypothetical protein